MTNTEQPEADAWEQRQSIEAADTETDPERAPEVGEADEADALDQQRSVDSPDHAEEYPPGAAASHNPAPSR